MKKNSDLIKKMRASFPYRFNFILISESNLYYENSPTSIIFSTVGNKCFFLRKKNAIIMKTKIIKHNLGQKLIPNLISHIVWKFKKDWMKKKTANLASALISKRCNRGFYGEVNG